MTRSISIALVVWLVAGAALSDDADAQSRLLHGSAAPALLVEGSPTLAPFQYVRFCLRYAEDCSSNVMGDDRIELTDKNSKLLDRVNREVNAAIAPAYKTYGPYLQERWTIAPVMGDCNDYAVTKRHELLRSGLPAKALRLAVVETPSGTAHLVLVVSTTRSDLVLDNLTDAVRPWQGTEYHWLKIQSAKDAMSWYAVSVDGPRADRKLGLADR